MTVRCSEPKCRKLVGPHDLNAVRTYDRQHNLIKCLCGECATNRKIRKVHGDEPVDARRKKRNTWHGKDDWGGNSYEEGDDDAQSNLIF